MHSARIAMGATCLALLVTAACSDDPTQVLVVTDSDLEVPRELDAIYVVVTRPDGSTVESTATLGADQPPLPRTLALVYEQGPLGPFDVRVIGRQGGADRIGRTARFSFQKGRTLVLVMHLTRRCIGAACGTGETCGEDGCRPVDVAPEELLAWTGSPPTLEGGTPPIDAATPDGGPGDGGPPDAGPADAGPADAGPADGGCTPTTELCNGLDDDCDTMVDEDFDLTSDTENCGTCGTACRGRTRLCCMGTCAETCP